MPVALGVRLDLTIVYAYIRFVDDFIDNEPDSTKKKRNYDMIKQFTDEMFADRNSDRDVRKNEASEKS